MDYPQELLIEDKCANCEIETTIVEIKNLVEAVTDLECTVNELRKELYMMKKEIVDKG